jgi:hypothetical protein
MTLGAMALCAVVPLRAVRAQVAVVVNRSNSLSNVSLEDLRRLYLGAATSFPNKETVILLESPKSRASFYHAALGMSEDRVKRHWIGMVFKGASAVPPKEIASPEELRHFVAEHAGAIAFIDASTMDVSVKLLIVDGHQPGDPTYPLR